MSKKNIIKDLLSLTSDLKYNFFKEEPIIDRRKSVRNKEEYVLQTDIASQEYLVEIAKGYHPDCKIISEELNNYHDLSFHDEGLVIIDPLDGTHNYYFGLPMWGFSYTVFSKSKESQESYIGIPMLDTLLSCYKSEVWAHNLNQEISDYKIEPKISKMDISDQMIAFDNQFYKDPECMKRNYEILIDNSFTTRISGSAVFDIAMIVLGKLNARIWHDTDIYDIAPAFAFMNKHGFILNLDSGIEAKIKDRRVVCTTDMTLHHQLKDIGFLFKT